MEAALGGVFVRVRAELGVGAFGLQVIDLPPHFDEPYAEHAHEGTDYEPPTTARRRSTCRSAGRATMVLGDERVELVPGMAVRVAPRSCATSSPPRSPFRMLAIGGVPGEPTRRRRSRARRRRSAPGALNVTAAQERVAGRGARVEDAAPVARRAHEAGAAQDAQVLVHAGRRGPRRCARSLVAAGVPSVRGSRAARPSRAASASRVDAASRGP
jgi:hypothetical protein